MIRNCPHKVLFVPGHWIRTSTDQDQYFCPDDKKNIRCQAVIISSALVTHVTTLAVYNYTHTLGCRIPLCVANYDYIEY